MTRRLLLLSLLMTWASAWATPCKADILFLDFNYSSAEVAAAQAAALKRGEKLIVLPEISIKERGEINALQAKRQQVEALNAKLDRERGLAKTKAEKDKIESKMVETVKTYTALTQLIHDKTSTHLLTQELVRAQLALAETSNKKITSVVISGHSNGVKFWGDATSPTSGSEFSSDVFADLLKAAPKAAADIRSLYLWGCYSTTQFAATTWKATLPNVALIGGFDNAAPLGATIASPALLQDFLIKDKKLIEERDVKAVVRDFKQLSNVASTNAAALINECYTNGKETHSLKDVVDCAKAMENIIKKREDVYEPYWEADDDAHANPPADAHHSDLRDYYTLVQQKRQCVESNHNMPIEKPEQILALIFFKNVSKNYCTFYKDEMARAKALVGTDAKPQGNTDCQDWSRKTWLNFMRDLRPQIVNEKPVSEADQKVFHHLYQAILSLRCVPTTWITDPPAPGQLPAAPQTSCIDSAKDD